MALLVKFNDEAVLGPLSLSRFRFGLDLLFSSGLYLDDGCHVGGFLFGDCFCASALMQSCTYFRSGIASPNFPLAEYLLEFCYWAM